MGADRMTGEYNLSWHQFVDHLRLLSQQFYQEGQYSDVTLVSDDQTQFKAHKFVLNACSPVFKKIIDNNPSQHPLIYLRGIQSYELDSILQFMYLGEAKVYQEKMGEFIKVAKDLEVKEIIGSEAENTKDENKLESIKLSRADCYYQATRPSHLQRHIKSEHEGIKYQDKRTSGTSDDMESKMDIEKADLIKQEESFGVFPEIEIKE